MLIERSLEALSKLDCPIALPRVGCGFGERDWEGGVRPMVEKYLGSKPNIVLVVMPKEVREASTPRPSGLGHGTTGTERRKSILSRPRGSIPKFIPPMPFSVGDRVRIRDDYGLPSLRGKTGTVTRITRSGKVFISPDVALPEWIMDCGFWWHEIEQTTTAG